MCIYAQIALQQYTAEVQTLGALYACAVPLIGQGMPVREGLRGDILCLRKVQRASGLVEGAGAIYAYYPENCAWAYVLDIFPIAQLKRS